MAKNFKIKRQKKVKTWLNKAMMRVVLPAYLAYLAVLLGVLAALLVCDLPDAVYMVASISFVALLFAAAIVVTFVVVPRCRAKQAMLDFDNYDFSPHTAADSETFSQTVQTEKYYFIPSPFDDDEGIIELADNKAAEDYFSQFSPERLKCVEELRAQGEFIPFNIFDFSEEYFEGFVEKRKEGEYITVTVTEKPTVTFAADGIRIGEKVFNYGEAEAFVNAEFIQLYARASVSLAILLSDECAVSFVFGTRIMSVIDKHKIAVKNREVADFILSDPKNAFKLIGRKRKISANKLRRQHCKN